jgi:GWxTD domain-containing protein
VKRVLGSARPSYSMMLGKAAVLRFRISLVVITLVMAATSAAQDTGKGDGNERAPAKPLTQKQMRQKEAAIRRALWKKWLNEDVAYIITDYERRSYMRLNTDEEREQFISQFWLRRDPTPDTVENEYKDEHYRRIAYSNEHFGPAIPGWKSDRGRIYIMFGPPDEINSHPATGSQRPMEEWSYRKIEGIGNDVLLHFVDMTGVGVYYLMMDPAGRSALGQAPF